MLSTRSGESTEYILSTNGPLPRLVQIQKFGVHFRSVMQQFAQSMCFTHVIGFLKPQEQIKLQ